MRFFTVKSLLHWAIISASIGMALSFVPWGSPDGLHGIGLPVYCVAWDWSRTSGRFIDFPNAPGVILNPLLVFLSGVFLWVATWLVFVLLRGILVAMIKSRLLPKNPPR